MARFRKRGNSKMFLPDRKILKEWGWDEDNYNVRVKYGNKRITIYEVDGDNDKKPSKQTKLDEIMDFIGSGNHLSAIAKLYTKTYDGKNYEKKIAELTQGIKVLIAMNMITRENGFVAPVKG